MSGGILFFPTNQVLEDNFTRISNEKMMRLKKIVCLKSGKDGILGLKKKNSVQGVFR